MVHIKIKDYAYAISLASVIPRYMSIAFFVSRVGCAVATVDNDVIMIMFAMRQTSSQSVSQSVSAHHGVVIITSPWQRILRVARGKAGACHGFGYMSVI